MNITVLFSGETCITLTEIGVGLCVFWIRLYTILSETSLVLSILMTWYSLSSSWRGVDRSLLASPLSVSDILTSRLWLGLERKLKTTFVSIEGQLFWVHETHNVFRICEEFLELLIFKIKSKQTLALISLKIKGRLWPCQFLPPPVLGWGDKVLELEQSLTCYLCRLFNLCTNFHWRN